MYYYFLGLKTLVPECVLATSYFEEEQRSMQKTVLKIIEDEINHFVDQGRI